MLSASVCIYYNLSTAYRQVRIREHRDDAIITSADRTRQAHNDALLCNLLYFRKQHLYTNKHITVQLVDTENRFDYKMCVPLTMRHRPHPLSLFARIAGKLFCCTQIDRLHGRRARTWLMSVVYCSEWTPFQMTRFYTLPETTTRPSPLPFPVSTPERQRAWMKSCLVCKLCVFSTANTPKCMDANGIRPCLHWTRVRQCAPLAFVFHYTQHTTHRARSVVCISILHAREPSRAAKSLCFNSIWPV